MHGGRKGPGGVANRDVQDPGKSLGMTPRSKKEGFALFGCSLLCSVLYFVAPTK